MGVPPLASVIRAGILSLPLRPVNREVYDLKRDGKGRGKFSDVLRDDWDGSLGAAGRRMMIESDEAMRATHRRAMGLWTWTQKIR
jgi:hypothetical protein